MTHSAWEMPPATCKPDGEPRQVGVEIELQGLAVERLAKIVRDTIGGDVKQVSRSEYEIEVPGQGTYRIEVDFALLKQMAKEEADDDDDEAPPDLVIEALDAVSSLLVPCEIVSPPLDMEAIAEPMDSIVEATRDAGAKGTGASVAYAFGVHLNVEPIDMEARTILAYMRAFVCLFDWIVWAGKVDLSRRVTPYINPFPRAYRELILEPDYEPDFEALVADYLEHNATRNRALDMLPMFAAVNEQAVFEAVDDDRIKARPAFHYRLENSCVDEAEWSLAIPWNRWIQIERLAADNDALASLCREYLADHRRVLHPVDAHWRERVQGWVKQS